MEPSHPAPAKKSYAWPSHSVIDIRILAQSLGRRRNNPHAKWPDQRRADYENDLWRKGLDKTFSNGRQYARAVEERWTRKYALDIVKTVHALRNRVAHHEPLVNGIPLPGENRRIALENATQACFALAMILDRDLHAWLMDCLLYTSDAADEL